MKISIQIDGVEQALQSAPSTSTVPAAPAAATTSAVLPPPAAASGLDDLFARAAALGAIDAGPAPAGLDDAATPAAPKTYIGTASQATGSDQSGGAAPGFDAGSGTA